MEDSSDVQVVMHVLIEEEKKAVQSEEELPKALEKEMRRKGLENVNALG